MFLIVALSSSDGTGALTAVLFAVIGWGDYADGIAARVTGQYSRLGALMDPVTDRLLIISGVVVCWHFQLLPRWALAVLAARELVMLVARALRLSAAGSSCASTGPGGSAVAPVMGSLLLRHGGPRTARRGAALRRARAGARGERDVLPASGRRAAAPPGAVHSLKLSLTFWAILDVSCRCRRALSSRGPAAGAKCPQREEATMDETFPDLGSLTDVELKDVIRQLTEEETEISYRRRILHGKIDILGRSWSTACATSTRGAKSLITGEDVQRLTDILCARGPPAERLAPSRAPMATALHRVRLRQRRGRQLLPALRRAAAAGRRRDGEPVTATYRIDETGELVPVEIGDGHRAGARRS